MYGCHSIRECYNLFSGVKLSIRSFCFILALEGLNFSIVFFPPLLNYHVPPIFTRYHFTGEKIIELLRERSLIMPEGEGGGGAGREIQIFAKNIHSPCQISIFFFIALRGSYIWFHGPAVLHMRF